MTADESEIETFVIVHDQDLLLACEQEGRFAGLSHFQYLFVGPREVSRLAGLSNVIVARELPDNIESSPNLLSFTGWYAVAKNGLTRKPWLTLLEYDVTLAPEFLPKTLEALRANRCILGYVPFPLSHPMYLHATPWLIPALQETHGLDLPKLLRAHLEAGGVDQWAATSNASLATSELTKFVDWFLPLSRVFQHDPLGAHVHERALPAYCFTMGLQNLVLPGVLQHRQARSHGIFARSWKEAEEQALSSRKRKEDGLVARPPD